MDFDPRDYDSRDDERHVNSSRGGSGGSTDDRDSDDDWRQPDVQPCDRNDADARTLGRGPGNDRQGSDEHARHRDDPRSGEREREHRERDRDERNPLTRHLYLPRGLERELVRDRGRDYTLRGSETRTLATVGAFRVVSSRDLRDHHDRPADPRSGDLRHLREQRLVETLRVPGSGEHAVVLSEGGPTSARGPP